MVVASADTSRERTKGGELVDRLPVTCTPNEVTAPVVGSSAASPDRATPLILLNRPPTYRRPPRITRALTREPPPVLLPRKALNVGTQAPLDTFS
jgi:hypothetical protein